METSGNPPPTLPPEGKCIHGCIPNRCPRCIHKRTLLERDTELRTVRDRIKDCVMELQGMIETVYDNTTTPGDRLLEAEEELDLALSNLLTEIEESRGELGPLVQEFETEKDLDLEAAVDEYFYSNDFGHHPDCGNE